ncbi:hypothetical protein [Streptomyces sp. NBC_00503]|uniref:hypothetical protein n=1 Tax=Streptomyces sp. NBC_00503 TaxID=2903659 RepID=UPI002E80D760|nr:hypothetical protein [Streptomyces sp. NBC_00503]WUD82842.1 hypothetical protein OG490_21090 [Streptomyces sp. NBC_00503]
MPRGRHRNPEPLHRLLTPTTVAGVSAAGAGAAWLLAEPMALRLLVVFTAAAGVAGAVVMRSWDRAAGRRVAELGRERIKDEWRTEERIAELESDLEEARVLRGKLDAKLRAKRVELAGLRGEHAALLRRYATAETERASALERRRLLAIEAAAAPAPTAPKALPPVSEERTSAGAPTAVGFARANAALAALSRSTQKPTPPPTSARELPAGSAAPAPAPEAHARPVPAGPAAAVPARRLAAAVAPYAQQRRSASRALGGFDFFGTKTAAQARAVIESVQNEDLADVVGAEVLAAHKAESAQGGAEPEFKAATAEHRAVGQVIDLTAHDETEPIDVAQLRTAIS